MTNLEKSIELARKNEGLFGWRNREECCVAACQEMAEWKDKQYQEKMIQIYNFVNCYLTPEANEELKMIIGINH